MNREDRFDQIKGTVNTLEGLMETVLLAIVYYFVWRNWYFDYEVFHPYLGRGKIVLMIVYAVIMYLMLRLCDGLRFGNIKLVDTVISQMVAAVVTNLLTYLQLGLIANVLVSFAPILILTGMDAVLMLISCSLFSAIYRRLYIPKGMLMIYGTENALSLQTKMDRHRDRYCVEKLMRSDASFDEMKKEILQYAAVLINDVPAQLRNDIVKYCYQKSVSVYIVPKISDIIIQGAPSVDVVDTPLLLVRGDGLSPGERFLKRFFDIVLCVIALIATSPVFFVIAILIKAEDGGPVFFRQRRVTKGGREFDILKFRSMIVNAEEAGAVIPAKSEDPRITRIGRGIRASRLDELPQILNILKGDMSIVGPRPERVEHVAQYTRIIPEFETRLKVKGGLTGYAQIYGKYNTTAYDKIRLDLMYIENYSILLDIRIILMTFRTLFQKESTEGFDKGE